MPIQEKDRCYRMFTCLKLNDVTLFRSPAAVIDLVNCSPILFPPRFSVVSVCDENRVSATMRMTPW